jgi:plasmid stability protein
MEFGIGIASGVDRWKVAQRAEELGFTHASPAPASPASWRPTGPEVAEDRTLTPKCAISMIFHMRTTLVIDDELFRRLKQRAAAEKRTLSDVTQEVLRRGLRADTRKRKRAPVKLPTFTMGRPLVDVADRDQLYEVLDRG